MDSSKSVGFLGFLALLFIGLKLGKVIDWSWWWVLSPFWLPWAIIAVIFLILLVMLIVYELYRGGHN